MAEKLIGRVTHFYPKISVAVIKLNDSLKNGDRIKFKHAGSEFEQVVTSMQIEHKQIMVAKAGQEIGMKTEQPVHENAEVYKVE